MFEFFGGMRRFLVCSVVVLLGLTAQVFAQDANKPKRIALIIGVDRYDHLPSDKQLFKAVNDAQAMETAFLAIGYRVTRAENISRLAFLQHWQAFLNAIQPGDLAAIFFAGHGVEIGGNNYLIPADVPYVREAEEEILKGASISFEFLLTSLRDRSPGVGLMILDACRNNPFTSTRGRSIGRTRGLTDAKPPQGMFIMYSAGAGEEALDSFGPSDPSANSVYTRALVPLLTVPGLDITELARRVRRDVHEQTQRIGHRQTPAYYDELIGQFCPAGCGLIQSAASRPAVSSPTTQEAIGAPSSPPEPLEDQQKPGAFEGTWRVKGKSSNCPLKDWNGIWHVTSGLVTSGKGEKLGTIDAGGRIDIMFRARNKSGQTAKTTGRIIGGRGSGTYTFRSCSGTFVMSRS